MILRMLDAACRSGTVLIGLAFVVADLLLQGAGSPVHAAALLVAFT